LRSFLADIHCVQDAATVLKVDNLGAIRLIKNPEFQKRTKHIDVQYHYVRDRYDAGLIIMPKYVSTKSQLADLFTKALPADQFKSLRSQIGIKKAWLSSGSVELGSTPSASPMTKLE
jgi:hypothetical protein